MHVHVHLLLLHHHVLLHRLLQRRRWRRPRRDRGLPSVGVNVELPPDERPLFLIAVAAAAAAILLVASRLCGQHRNCFFLPISCCVCRFTRCSIARRDRTPCVNHRRCCRRSGSSNNSNGRHIGGCRRRGCSNSSSRSSRDSGLVGSIGGRRGLRGGRTRHSRFARRHRGQPTRRPSRHGFPRRKGGIIRRAVAGSNEPLRTLVPERPHPPGRTPLDHRRQRRRRTPW